MVVQLDTGQMEYDQFFILNFEALKVFFFVFLTLILASGWPAFHADFSTPVIVNKP